MSVRSKRDIERLKQVRVAERLEQTRHGTLFERSQTDGLVSLSGNEDDRNLLPGKLQFSLEIRSGHAWHGDVENQAPRLIDVVGREKCFRRAERLDRKAELNEQIGQRLAGLSVDYQRPNSYSDAQCS